MTKQLPWALLVAVTGCVGVIDDPDRSDPGSDPGEWPEYEPESEAAKNLGLRRLTKAQIVATLADVFGTPADVASELAEVTLDPKHYGQYTTQAARSDTFTKSAVSELFDTSFAAVEPLFADAAARESLVGCAPASADDACSRAYLERIGRRLFRRPLEPEELSRHQAVATAAAAHLGGDVWQGLAYATAGLLQSPWFVYAPEPGVDDPKRATHRLYTSLELATRLSLALTNANPDEALLDRAEAGELTDAAVLADEARRLLESDAGKRGITRGFFREWLTIDVIGELGKDPNLFPIWNADVARDLEREIELLFDDHVFERKAPFATLFTRRDTFVNDRLAKLYGIDGIAGTELVPYAIPDNWERVGVLGTGAFLAVHAGTLEPSPTRRGRFIRTRVLCEDIPDPPPNVAPLPEPGTPGAPKTKRERLSQHATDPVCANCHTAMDPLGFGLDHFDAVGSFRQTENGEPIDTSGEIDGQPFVGAPALAKILSESDKTRRCISIQFFRYAAGRDETDSEREVLGALGISSPSFFDLALAVVGSDPFRSYPKPKE